VYVIWRLFNHKSEKQEPQNQEIQNRETQDRIIRNRETQNHVIQSEKLNICQFCEEEIEENSMYCVNCSTKFI